MHPIHTFSMLGIREPFCSLSHIAGAVVFAMLAVELLRRGRGDRVRLLSLIVMVVASVQTLVLSSLYHMLWPGPFREFMLRADVAGIFILIAGSITPVHAILFRGFARWVPLGVVWSVALMGIILRIVYFDKLPGFMGVLIFLVYGWGGAITAAVLWMRYGWSFVRSAVLQGVAYTAGALVLVMHSPTLIQGIIGPHELWHLAVLGGLALHWNFVFQFATGAVPKQVPRVPDPLIRIGTPAMAMTSDRMFGSKPGDLMPVLETTDPRSM